MRISKERIFKIIQIGSRTDIPSIVFDVFISIVILVCVTVTFMQTFDTFQNVPLIQEIEFATIIIFIIEFALRIYTADLLYPGYPQGTAILKFIFSFFGMVDLLSIISYFVPVWFTSGVVALRVLRVMRIARLFRFSSEYDAFDMIFNVLRERKNQIISSVIIIVLLMFMASMLMYSIEHDAQPEAFANGFSGMWWAVSTILTVGYGDIYPVTTFGKIMAIVIAFLGVGLVAMPTGIISAGFVEEYHREALREQNQSIQTIMNSIPGSSGTQDSPVPEKGNGTDGNAQKLLEKDAPAVSTAKAEVSGLRAALHAPGNYTEDDEIVIAILEKQEARKLLDGHCPLCGTNMRSLRPSYCPVCGQRLGE